MKNNAMKTIFIIVGAVVTVGAIALALVHFWDDIKSLLPCKKCDDLCEDFADEEI